MGIDEQIARECLAVRVRTLGRVLTALYDDAMRPHGLTTAQLNILVAVSRRAPASAGRVGEVLALEKSTLSRNLDRMRRQGWIEQRPAARGRGRDLYVTAAGAALLRRVFPDWKRAQARARELLGAALADSVHGLASRARAGSAERRRARGVS